MRRLIYNRSLVLDWEKELFHLTHRNQHRESSKMKKQRSMSQTKEQDTTLGKNLNEKEVTNLADKKFKVMVMKILSTESQTNRATSRHI